MTFGTADRRKWDVAEGVALAVGHFADAPRQPPRASRPSATATPTHSPPRQGSAGLLGSCSALRREPDLEPVGRDVARRGARPARPARPAPRRSSSSSRTSAARATGGRAAAARRPPRRDRGRDPRPARAGAAGRRRPLARRPRDGPAAARRHAQRASCGARFGEPPRPSATRSRASCRSLGVAHVVALDLGRLAAAARRLPADRKEAAMSFAWPLALCGLVLVAAGAARVPASCSGGGASTSCASRTSPCSRTSSPLAALAPARPAGARRCSR